MIKNKVKNIKIKYICKIIKKFQNYRKILKIVKF